MPKVGSTVVFDENKETFNEEALTMIPVGETGVWHLKKFGKLTGIRHTTDKTVFYVSVYPKMFPSVIYIEKRKAPKYIREANKEDIRELLKEVL